MLALVERAKRGDKASFVKLIEMINSQAYKTAYIQLGDPEDVKDAMQETIFKAYERIYTLTKNEFFKTWFIRILLNECHNIQRKKSKIISLTQKQIHNQKYENRDSCQIVEMKDLINDLSSIHKIVIDLRYNHNFKINEIAQMLEIPEGTVKSRLNKALKILRKEIFQKEVAK